MQMRLDEYRLLGRSGLRVSPLCLGTMTFGSDWGWGADRETSRQMFDRYAEAGGNFIDTADFYTFGTSEKLVGEFIKRDRDRFVVSTKYSIHRRKGDPNAGGNHRKSMMEAVDASLRRMQIECIDLYWLHMWDFTTPVDELMRAFDDLVRMGKVHYLAISDTPAWKIAQLNTFAEARTLTRFVATQCRYSIADRAVERDLLPMARELGIAMLPWAPLAGGVLTGKYTKSDADRIRAEIEDGGTDRLASDHRQINITDHQLAIGRACADVAESTGRSPAQIALSWLLAKAGVTSIILGARNLSQLDDNLGCLDFNLEADNLDRLDKISEIDPGFPHDFLSSPLITRDILTGGCEIRGLGPRSPCE